MTCEHPLRKAIDKLLAEIAAKDRALAAADNIVDESFLAYRRAREAAR